MHFIRIIIFKLDKLLSSDLQCHQYLGNQIAISKKIIRMVSESVF